MIARRALITGGAALAAYATLTRPASAAVALVAHTFAQSVTGSGTVTSGAIDTSGASLLVVISVENTGQSLNFNDSKSNTWLTARSAGDGPAAGFIIYAANPTVGTGHTFTGGSGAANNQAFAVLAFSGVLTVSPLDQVNSSSGTTPLATGSITPLQNNEVWVAGCVDDWTGTMAVSTGTIVDQSPLSPAGHVAFAISSAYGVQTTAAPVNPTFTATAGPRVFAMIASFKAAPVTGRSRLIQ